MPKFDTRVQELRYRVLKEIAKHIYNDDLNQYFYILSPSLNIIYLRYT